jgi:hypothetical protein
LQEDESRYELLILAASQAQTCSKSNSNLQQVKLKLAAIQTQTCSKSSKVKQVKQRLAASQTQTCSKLNSNLQQVKQRLAASQTQTYSKSSLLPASDPKFTSTPSQPTQFSQAIHYNSPPNSSQDHPQRESDAKRMEEKLKLKKRVACSHLQVHLKQKFINELTAKKGNRGAKKNSSRPVRIN